MKEKSMKKSVAILCMGLILGGSVITGCSLVTTNYEKYYGAVACTIEFNDGSRVEITRKALRIAYVSYGFDQYVQNGLSQEEAYTKALDYLVSKELAIKDAEDKSRKLNPDDAILTAKEKTYLWEKTYESMIENIKSYINVEGETEEEVNEDAVTREIFKREVELVYNQAKNEYSVILPESAKSDFESHKFWSEANKDAQRQEDKEEIYQLMLEYIDGSLAYKDAYKQYLSDLKESEKNFNLSKDVKSIFVREIERVYGIMYDTYMVGKYEDFLGGEKTNNTVIRDILDLYESKVRNDYSAYAGLGKAQADAVKEKSGDIYYFEDGINWFYVTHILVKFDENEQKQYDYYKAEIDKIKEGKESEISLSQAQDGIEALYNNLTGIKRVETSENVWEEQQGVTAPNVSKLFEDIKKQVDTGLPTQKIENFTDLIYEYNEDPGMLNAKYNYIVGVDYTTPSQDEEGNVKNYTVYSDWVQEFNDAAVELYDNGNGVIGTIYEGGDYNGLIRSDYGVHIMMYAGEAKSLFNGINANFELQTEDIITLYNSRLNQGTKKTYFDLMYEELVPSDSTVFQSLDLKRLQEATKAITYYPKAF